jgi:hypothetical protein
MKIVIRNVLLFSGIAVLGATSAIAQTPPTTSPETGNSSAASPHESHAPVQTQPNSTQNRPTTVAPESDQFSSMDTDKDGKIFVSEYTSATMEAFKSMDKDRDGKISGVELTEVQPPSSGSPSPLSSAQLSAIDTNKDVQITATEMSSGAARMFKNLDVNADGFLTANELNGRQYRSDTEASADSRRKDGASVGTNNGTNSSQNVGSNSESNSAPDK